MRTSIGLGAQEGIILKGKSQTTHLEKRHFRDLSWRGQGVFFAIRERDGHPPGGPARGQGVETLQETWDQNMLSCQLFENNESEGKVSERMTPFRMMITYLQIM